MKKMIVIGLLALFGAACGTAAAQDSTDPVAVAPIEAAPVQDTTVISASEAADYLTQTEPAMVAEFCSLLKQLPQDAALQAFSEGYDSEWTPGMPTSTDLFYELAGRC